MTDTYDTTDTESVPNDGSTARPGVVEHVGEGLARRINRRSALQGFAKLCFGATATWAAGGLFGAGAAYAATCQTTERADHYCNPPGGNYCTLNHCSGENCAGGCTIYKGFYSQTGCWCTGTYPNSNCTSRGYYKCCDCKCGSSLCGCASYHSNCSGGPGTCC